MENLFSCYRNYVPEIKEKHSLWKTIVLLAVLGFTALLGCASILISLIRGMTFAEINQAAPTVFIWTIVSLILIVPVSVFLIMELKDSKLEKKSCPIHIYVENDENMEEILISFLMKESEITFVGTKEYTLLKEDISYSIDQYFRMEFIYDEKQFYILASIEDAKNGGILEWLGGESHESGKRE